MRDCNCLVFGVTVNRITRSSWDKWKREVFSLLFWSCALLAYRLQEVLIVYSNLPIYCCPIWLFTSILIFIYWYCFSYSNVFCIICRFLINWWELERELEVWLRYVLDFTVILFWIFGTVYAVSINRIQYLCWFK